MADKDHAFTFASSTFMKEYNKIDLVMRCDTCNSVTTIRVTREEIISGDKDFMISKEEEMRTAHILARDIL